MNLAYNFDLTIYQRLISAHRLKRHLEKQIMGKPKKGFASLMDSRTE